MTEQIFEGLTGEMATRSLEALREFSTSDKMLREINKAAVDNGLWQAAKTDSTKFLRSRGLDIPPEITVTFADGGRDTPWSPPDPDLDLVVVRTWWVCHREDTAGPEGGRVRACVRFSLEVPRQVVRV
jgi:hypothetical protein